MEVAILKTDGTPVRLGTSFTSPSFDVNGFLVGFNFKSVNGMTGIDGIYKYYQNGDFKSNNRSKADLEGYFRESSYLKYLQAIDDGSTVTIDDMVKTYKFDFTSYIATVGDSVNVNVVNFSPPYDNYYSQKKYIFAVEVVNGSQEVRKYKKTVFDNFKIIGYEIDVPTGIAGVDTFVNLMKEPEGYFFSKNFGSYADGWNIDATEKSKIKKLATLIAYKISYIVKDIFPKILDKNELVYLQGVANRVEPGISDLKPIEQTVFTLLLNWGYFYIPDANPDLIYRADFPSVLSKESVYQDYFFYYGSLMNFYFDCYKIQDKLLSIPEKERLNYLLQLLTIDGLTAIPYEIIIGVLKDLINGTRRDGQSLSEEVQQFVVRLVISISVTKNQKFLDFLLTDRVGTMTNFEILYNLLDSARLERIAYVSWFVDEQPNRKYFAFAVFDLWKNSIYNFNYFPVDTSHEGITVNPNSYFIKNSSDFNKNNVLIFENINTTTNNNLPTYIEIKFESTFAGNKIRINTKKKETKYYISGSMTDHVTEEFGLFHLYHPIALSGYKINTDLAIPGTAIMPAFMFHFVEEYDRLADFDAGISLMVDLTMDVLIFYFTGGAGILSDLSYLQDVSRLGRAMRGLLGATESVEVWRGLEAGAEVFSLTQTALMDINTYLITKENDPERKKILEHIQELFLGLLILTGTASVGFRIKAGRSAGDVLTLIEALPAGQPTGITDELKGLLIFLKNEKDVTLTLFGNELKNMDLGEGVINNLFVKYDSYFNKAEQWSFWNGFNEKSYLDFRKLNEAADGQTMLNWQSLFNEGIAEASNIEFITKQNFVDGILRYYEDVDARAVLEGFSKKDKELFLNLFGEAVEGLPKLSVEKIEEWKGLVNYTDRELLKEYEHFWISSDFSINLIKETKYLIEHARTVFSKRKISWILLPENEARAMKYISNANNWSNGEFFEKVAHDYLRNKLNENERIFASVDMAFYSYTETGKIEKIGGRIQEIDILRIDGTINKAEEVYSVKVPIEVLNAEYEITRINLYRDLPSEGAPLRQYIADKMPDALEEHQRNKIDFVKIKYYDVTISTAKQEPQDFDPGDFSKMLKNSYLEEDIFQINPETVKTSKEILMKNAYHVIIKKLKFK